MADSKKKMKLIDELRTLDDKQLQERVKAARVQLMEHYRSLAAQELPSSAVIRKTRKEVAAILTVAGEKRRTPSNTKEEEK